MTDDDSTIKQRPFDEPTLLVRERCVAEDAKFCVVLSRNPYAFVASGPLPYFWRYTFGERLKYF